MEVFLDALTDAAIKMAIVLIPIIFAVLTRYLILYLNKQIASLEMQGKETELIILRELTNIAVLAADQILDTNPQKFKFAASHLLATARELGILLSDDQALALVESSVRAIRNELPLEPLAISGQEVWADGSIE